MYSGVLVISAQNQVPQIVIEMGGLPYYIKTFSVMIQTTKKFLKKFVSRKNKKSAKIFLIFEFFNELIVFLVIYLQKLFSNGPILLRLSNKPNLYFFSSRCLSDSAEKILFLIFLKNIVGSFCA